jgi:hypothetical protein
MIIVVPEIDIGGKQNIFHLQTAARIFYFSCDSKEERQKWVSALTEVIPKQNNQKIMINRPFAVTVCIQFYFINFEGRIYTDLTNCRMKLENITGIFLFYQSVFK